MSALSCPYPYDMYMYTRTIKVHVQYHFLEPQPARGSVNIPFRWIPLESPDPKIPLNYYAEFNTKYDMYMYIGYACTSLQSIPTEKTYLPLLDTWGNELSLKPVALVV